MTERISNTHAESRGTYGRPRVHAEFREEGVRVSPKRIARLVREARLEGVSRRRRTRTTRRKAKIIVSSTSSNETSLQVVPIGFGWRTSRKYRLGPVFGT